MSNELYRKRAFEILYERLNKIDEKADELKKKN